jgi:glutaminase
MQDNVRNADYEAPWVRKNTLRMLRGRHIRRSRSFMRFSVSTSLSLAALLAFGSLVVAQPAPTATAKAPSKSAATSKPNYQALLERTLAEVKAVKEGKNADYIPALAKVDSNLFGIVIVTVDGKVYEVGDARSEFSIQSAAKPFVLARTMSAVGHALVEERIGVNQTGQAFNSVLAIGLLKNAKQPPAGNPLVHAGAIATVDALPASSAGTKWTAILDTFNGFAGRLLEVNQEVYRSESETNQSNHGIAMLLDAYEVIQGNPVEALDLYTRECSVNVTARDLATMGATLANGGKNPLTGQQVVSAEVAQRVLAVMATTGLYETTGQWLYHVGVPAKSGVGGGIVAVVPGRFAIGTFAPPLDEAGNSVRGQKSIQKLIEELGGNVFASTPHGKPAAKGGTP